jgi:tRNA A58 N-methylase Trm61
MLNHTHAKQQDHMTQIIQPKDSKYIHWTNIHMIT